MPTRVTLDDPRTIESVEWFAGLIHDWDVMPSPEAATKLCGQEGNAAYICWRLKADMYMGWLSDGGGETWGPQAKWRTQWGMLPLPRDERPATLGMAYAHAISSDTEYPDACWEWLMFLNDQIPPCTMPACRSLAESDAYRERAGAGMIGAGIGGPVADYLNVRLPGLGYFVIFGGYGVLFLLSVVSLRGVAERD